MGHRRPLAREGGARQLSRGLRRMSRETAWRSDLGNKVGNTPTNSASSRPISSTPIHAPGLGRGDCTGGDHFLFGGFPVEGPPMLRRARAPSGSPPKKRFQKSILRGGIGVTQAAARRYRGGAENCARTPVPNGPGSIAKVPANGKLRSRSTRSEKPTTIAIEPAPMAWNQKLRDPTRAA